MGSIESPFPHFRKINGPEHVQDMNDSERYLQWIAVLRSAAHTLKMNPSKEINMPALNSFFTKTRIAFCSMA